MNGFAFALVLASSGVLAWLLRDGKPDRRILTGLLGTMAVLPALARWQAGWLALFVTMPWIAWVRRVQLLIAPQSEGIERFDPLLLVPDALAGVALLGYLLMQRFSRRVEPQPGERLLHSLLVGLVGITFLEVFNPLMGSVAAGVNGLRVFTLYVGLYWVTAHVCQLEERVHAWISVTVFAGLVSGLYGIGQHFVGLPSYDWIWVHSAKMGHQMVGDKVRIFSTFSFTSTFSHFALIGVCFGLTAWRLRRLSLFTQLLSPLCTIVSLSALLLTFVRSSYVGLFVALVAGAVLAGEPRRRLLRLVGLFAVGAACVFLLPSSAGDSARVDAPSGSASAMVAQRLTSIGQGAENSSVSYRVGLWKRHFALVTEFIPMGVGIGAGSGTRFGGDPWAETTAYTESQFVSALAELGWPGFLLFVGTTVFGLVYTVRTHDRLIDPERRRLLHLCFMVQCGILIAGITGGPVLYTQPGCAYYWAALGIVTALSRAEAAERRREAEALTAVVPPGRLPLPG
ncbi:MAG: O-antigen ligase family protein [Candidatus Sericytochromatia bacterium]|nr:O-antigen ligase family protein [Candidatus Sericytochromatia bacterium]